eukprot:882146-Prymnesium_polylepis.1
MVSLECIGGRHERRGGCTLTDTTSADGSDDREGDNPHSIPCRSVSTCRPKPMRGKPDACAGTAFGLSGD